MEGYIIGIDQSTQGTKALLFDIEGRPVSKNNLLHKQIINEKGWIEHDPNEIYSNVLLAVKKVVEESGIDKNLIKAVGISNQRETTLAWKEDGTPYRNAIVWQCARAKEICREIAEQIEEKDVEEVTGVNLSPYFPAAKLTWLMRNDENIALAAQNGTLKCGTIDTYLIYRLTGNKEYRTDYSNAARTQLFNIHSLCWDEKMCNIFGIPIEILPKVTDSDGFFGSTDFEGFLDKKIPIHAVLGDSNAALFGQGCLNKGMTKATYGTGSSVMMNIGDKPAMSSHGLVTSIAWKIGDSTNYVLEGNINYSGAVITWLKDDLGLIESARETQELSMEASKDDETYLVPAFSGLGAPYWDSSARAVLCNMSRTTGKKEVVRAAVDCIAYQITDILFAMQKDSEAEMSELSVDGGATANEYLMQFQSDISGIDVCVSPFKELSGMGAAFLAGIAIGEYDALKVMGRISKKRYFPKLSIDEAKAKYSGWNEAVQMIIGSNKQKED